ncbi:MAG: hypothetical protein JXR86_02920 [Spirochaetales bacterium]|nr:hypothetical protein [Spirochaetales bacterium]
MRARYVFLLVLLLFPFYPLSAITISLSGSWSLSIDSSDVSSGAGGDLNSQYQSNADQVSLDIGDLIDSGDAWELQVHKEDLLWHSDMILGLLRTSGGSGAGTISGGDSLFLELTATDQYFFDGTGDRSLIDIQLRLSGISVVIPADTYSTTIYFTVIDTP